MYHNILSCAILTNNWLPFEKNGESEHYVNIFFVIIQAELAKQKIIIDYKDRLCDMIIW